MDNNCRNNSHNFFYCDFIEGTGVRRISDGMLGEGTRGWMEVPKWVFESWYLFIVTSELS
jgi:hypothetical protein